MLSDPATSPSTSISLLKLAQRNEPTAWRRLAHIYGDVVYGWARQLSLQDVDAADVTQEVFQAVYRALPTYQTSAGGSFRGWLWTITRNKVRDSIRARQARPNLATAGELDQATCDYSEAMDSDLPPAGGEIESLVHRAAQLIRQDFDARSWTCFERMVLEGQSAADVAAELGMSVPAVRQAKYRVLKHLRAFCSDLS